MSYSDKQEALRSALWNFIGALSTTSLYEGEMGKQSVVGIIAEELTKLCMEESGEINMVVAKPLFRSVNWMLEKRIENLNKLDVKYDNSIIDLNKSLTSYIDKF